MNIPWIFRGLLFLVVVYVNLAESSNWIDNLRRYIVKKSDIREIALITSSNDKIATLRNPQVNEIFRKLIRNFPTTVSNVEDHVDNNAVQDDSIADTTTTLFLIIEESRDLLSLLPARSTIDSLLETSQWKTPKFLLVLVSPRPRDSLEELLKYAWTRKLLDFTIVELTEPEVTEISLNPVYSVKAPIIHRYNPFRRLYTRLNWTTSIRWFPKKAKNMRGYPLKIGVVSEPPFSYVVLDKVRHVPTKVYGGNIDMVKTIAERLNFVPEWVAVSKFMELKRDPTPNGMYELMASGKIDLLSMMEPHYTESWKRRTVRTMTVATDSLCPIVPILPSVKIPIMENFLQAYVICFGIIVIFWIVRRSMKFQPIMWQTLNVIRLLFGISVTRQPKKNVERVMFACLLAVSSIYSSKIYSALTEISFDMEAVMEINSFDDLDQSGLTPIINSLMYNKTFAYSDGPLINIKKKTLHYTNIDDCPYRAARYKNVTCITGKTRMTMILEVDKKLGKRVKIVEPCFWSDSKAFLLGRGSPYRIYINRVIARLHDSGLMIKWYGGTGTTGYETREKSIIDDDDDISSIAGANKSKKTLYQLMGIAIVGYSLSLLAFIGEIVYHRIMRSRQRK